MKYTTDFMMYNSYGEVGYRLTDEKGNKEIVLNRDLKKFIDNPSNTVDLDISSGKVVRKNSKAKIPLQNMQNKPIKAPILCEIETCFGNELERKLKSEKRHLKVRSEITIIDYLKGKVDKYYRICTVCGVRFTGKRDLVKNDLLESGLASKAIWVTVKTSMTHIELKMEIDAVNTQKNIKVIVVEKSENVCDLHEAEWLVQMANKGTKVVFITPGDIMLKQSTKSAFYGVVYSVYTTAMTYKDYKYINKNKNIKFLQYCESKSIVFSDIKNPILSNDLVDKKIPVWYNVVDDLCRTVIPNKAAYNYFVENLNCKNKDIRSSMMAEIYKIVKAVIETNGDRMSNKPIDVSICNVGIVDKVVENELGEELSNKLTEAVGIPKYYNGNQFLYELITSAFMEMGIMFSLQNTAKKTIEEESKLSREYNLSKHQYRYQNLYFTTPVIVNRLTNFEVNTLNSGYIPRPSDACNHRFGYIFESAVAYNAYTIAKENGKCNVFFYRDKLQREIDLIIATKRGVNSKLVCCEIKSTESVKNLGNKKARWLCDEFTDRVAKGTFSIKEDNIERYIIYAGDDVDKKLKLHCDDDRHASIFGAESMLKYLETIQ